MPKSMTNIKIFQYDELFSKIPEQELLKHLKQQTSNCSQQVEK